MQIDPALIFRKYEVSLRDNTGILFQASISRSQVFDIYPDQLIYGVSIKVSKNLIISSHSHHVGSALTIIFSSIRIIVGPPHAETKIF